MEVLQRSRWWHCSKTTRDRAKCKEDRSTADQECKKKWWKTFYSKQVYIKDLQTPL